MAPQTPVVRDYTALHEAVYFGKVDELKRYPSSHPLSCKLVCICGTTFIINNQLLKFNYYKIRSPSKTAIMDFFFFFFLGLHYLIYCYRLLEEGKIDVNTKTVSKETTLHYALCHNKPDCIEPLISHGANPNKRELNLNRCPLFPFPPIILLSPTPTSRLSLIQTKTNLLQHPIDNGCDEQKFRCAD